MTKNICDCSPTHSTYVIRHSCVMKPCIFPTPFFPQFYHLKMAEAPPNTVFAEVWGWTFVALLFQLTWWLHAIVPAAGGARTAYVTDPATHAPLRYQTNALRVMLIVTATAAAAVHFQLMGASDLATHYWPAARAAFFFGGCASVMLYTRGAKVLRQGKLDKGTSCTTIAGARSAAAASTEEFDNLSALEHFFCGYEWNPRGVSTGIDLKVPSFFFPPSPPRSARVSAV